MEARAPSATTAKPRLRVAKVMAVTLSAVAIRLHLEQLLELLRVLVVRAVVREQLSMVLAQRGGDRGILIAVRRTSPLQRFLSLPKWAK